MCEQPLATGGFNHEEFERISDEKLESQGYEGEDYERQMRKLKARQLEYEEYIAEAEKKAELRKTLANGEMCDIIHPRQVICIALRTKDVQAQKKRRQKPLQRRRCLRLRMVFRSTASPTR